LSPNPNYLRGVRAEYALKRLLEPHNYFVTRAAGSHGLADLVAYGPDGTTYIQVKSGSYDESGQNLNELKQIAKGCNHAHHFFELWVRSPNNKWRVYNLKDDTKMIAKVTKNGIEYQPLE
jgi:Holliday junction resolvase